MAANVNYKYQEGTVVVYMVISHGYALFPILCRDKYDDLYMVKRALSPYFAIISLNPHKNDQRAICWALMNAKFGDDSKILRT